MTILRFWSFCLAILVLALTGCDKDLTAAQDEPLIDYVLVVTDSSTKQPLDSVRVRVKTLSGDTSTHFTDSREGRVELPTLTSSKTLFVLSRQGFKTLNLVDSFSGPRDTLFNRPAQRLLQVKMDSLNSGVLGKPRLESQPSDTVSPGDTLLFKFSQAVAFLDRKVVRLTNLSNDLFIEHWFDSTGKNLRIIQRESGWLPGKRYEYELQARNSKGDYFVLPNTSSQMMRGSFFVRESKGTDSSLIHPVSIRLAYFNSGASSRFDSLHLESSRLPDSTTRFARLKWNWSKPAGRRVDSLLILVSDGGPAIPSWIIWMSIPGSVDSASLDFADLYSTRNGLSQKPIFPLRAASTTGEINIRVLPKHGSITVDAQDTTLGSVRQGMGPSLHAKYVAGHVLANGVGATDSIDVFFLTNPADSTSAFNFGADTATVKPRLFLNNQAAADNPGWKWISRTKGRLYYSFTGRPPLPTVFRADLHDVIFRGSPIWQRNRQDGVEIP